MKTILFPYFNPIKLNVKIENNFLVDIILVSVQWQRGSFPPLISGSTDQWTALLDGSYGSYSYEGSMNAIPFGSKEMHQIYTVASTS